MEIVFDRVSVIHSGRCILKNISLSLNHSRIGIIGDNGSGKTTFARLINGLIIPDEGHVYVDGMSTRTSAKEIRKKVGFLFQNPDNQIVMPTVSEDLLMGLRHSSLRKSDKDQRLTRVVDEFGLNNITERSAHLLSGGEKQLVALAGVMITSPEILICDEPTTLLDIRNSNRVVGIIKELNCSVLLITHKLDYLQDFDHVIMFESGNVFKQGSPSDVIKTYLNTLQ